MPSEARQFLNIGLFLHIFLYGVIPSAIVVWVKISHRPYVKKVAYNTVFIIISIAIAGSLIALNSSLYASVFRNKRDFLKSLNPVAPISSTIRYASAVFNERNIKMKPLGEDARRGAVISAARKPVLLIVVAGETARTQNFSLNGYARETNSELAKRDVTSFTNVSSCGTATAKSLPCMFSVYGRADYTNAKNLGSENLLDVLKRAGFEVTWLDNNGGSKRIADRVNFKNLSIGPAQQKCPDNECDDRVLLDWLRGNLGTITRDTVLVMHQLGSHGPDYFRRYPPEFEKFTPTCKTPRLANCTLPEITNAYDNTIVYTDYILSRIIDLLKANQETFIPAMIYISDHGESLGEYGLYLHSIPYFMAPDTQTKVPLISWISQEFADTMQLDKSCINALKDGEYSQDNLFHTVLGAVDVDTKVYQQGLDIVAPCRGGKP